jgi:hypothetical protein
MCPSDAPTAQEKNGVRAGWVEQGLLAVSDSQSGQLLLRVEFCAHWRELSPDKQLRLVKAIAELAGDDPYAAIARREISAT